MSIDIQTLHDVLIALTATVGIAVVVSILMIAAGAFAERGKKIRHPARHESGPAQHVVPGDESRELILR
jgi:hypothetical protein